MELVLCNVGGGSFLIFTLAWLHQRGRDFLPLRHRVQTTFGGPPSLLSNGSKADGGWNWTLTSF